MKPFRQTVKSAETIEHKAVTQNGVPDNKCFYIGFVQAELNDLSPLCSVCGLRASALVFFPTQIEYM